MRWFHDPAIAAEIARIAAAPDWQYADVQSMLAERGIAVPLETVGRRMRKMGCNRDRECAGHPTDSGRSSVNGQAHDPERITREEQDKRRLDDARSENAALRKALADRQDFLDSLREEFARYPILPITPPPRDTRPHRPRTLIAHISDVHTGQIMGGTLGKYDLALFEERAHRLTSKIMAITDDLRAGGPVDDLILALGGDLADGRTIHPGHTRISVPITTQLRVGPEVLSRAVLAPLAGYFPRVQVRAVPGNHGRLGKPGDLDIVGDSLDLVFVQGMRWLCKDIPNVVWHETKDWYSLFKVHGHTFFLAHGDNFKAWLGIPFYGSQRFMSRVQSMLHRPIDVMLVGHHHNPAAFPHGYANIIMNGSWVGTGEYGAWLGLAGAPIQKLLLVSDDYAAATSYDLHLAMRDELLTLEVDA